MMLVEIHIIISIIIIIISLIAILHKNIKTSSFAIAGIGLILGIEFILLQAYIVAIAEIGLLSCVTTIFLLKTINSTDEKEEEN